MAALVVQRFRECQNLLDSVVASLSAISNLTSQRTVVEEATRRICCSSPSSCGGGNALRCCTDPLGVLLAFPESAVELIIAQHAEDVSTLLRSLGNSQQGWCSKLQQAKDASLPLLRQQPGASIMTVTSAACPQLRDKERHQHLSHSPQLLLGIHALLAVLSEMHGWLQELILALRADLANPPQAVQLSQCLSGHSSRAGGAGGCIAVFSLEAALEQLPDRVLGEWEACKARHMLDESWILLAG
ncbi:uncharacterized protein Tco025E_03449 [Trypanosoma conorhini]|uniref:Uncharacterized protein n=1 Tax=Trypanosoma conorhini TaxID=83891 RepID=A0A422PU52_9TRYP|nr:uncharacterized protein Tco025E_03449 [Trypanosoma conorhini]RNF21266.1 hypothetical protein Tco025E_03449 [Trypanosoma conorhini]